MCGTLEFKATCSLELLMEQLTTMNNYMLALEARAKVEHIQL